MSASSLFRRINLLWLWLLALTSFAQNVPKSMTDYHTDWRTADSLMARGLPKSALEIANRVYADAKRTGNQPQLLKAALRRVVFRTQAAPDDETYLTLLRELTADIADTRGASRAVLQSVLAQVYEQYYQQNRYRFLGRTATAPTADVTAPESATSPGDAAIDPRAWDLRRLMRTISTLYVASVEDARTLQQTSLQAYDAVLMPGDRDGRALRPTLYDVLAQRAIAYFSNTENDLPRPVQAFDVNNPAYLGDAETFVQQALPTTDLESGRYRALTLYQQLIRFHLADKDPLALAVVDVERLRFVQQSGTLPNERDLTEKTLRQAIVRYKGQPAEAEYALALIQLLAQGEATVRPRYGRGSGGGTPAPADSARRLDRRAAASLARDLIARLPDTYPAQQAQPILDNLLKPALTVQTEEVVAPNKPFRARVEFQNAKTLFYKLLRLTPDELLAFSDHDYQTDPTHDKWFAALLTHKVVAQGQLALPDDGDLHSHSTEIPLDALPLGHYALLVSNEGRFAKPSDERAEIVTIGKVVVSNLAYVQPNGYRNTNSTRSFFVTDRQTGAPLAGVSVTVLTAKERVRGGQTAYTPGTPVQTDREGNVLLGPGQLPGQRTFVVRFANGADVLDAGPFYQYGQPGRNTEPQETQRAVLFTDRAIYRPGQTIHFKALLYQGKENNFAVMPNETLTVRLNDANGEEVAKLDLKTNGFGTATGTFTAPVGRLLGQMTLYVDKTEAEGQASIRVEEYKRPTFAVIAEPMKQAPTLGQTVTVRATAKTLAGAVVDGAAVSYRVTRTYVQPYWHGWTRRPGAGGEQEIANGTATTGPDGTVSLTFVAQPDATIDPKDKPRFTYTVTLDVTDRSGETRSTTQTLYIGYTALTARFDVPDPVLTTDKRTYIVLLTNASDVPVPLKTGTVTISQLQPPRNGTLLRNRLWERPDRTTMTRAEFEKLFPLDLYADEGNPATWAKTPVRTERADAVSLADLKPGLYEAAIQATDSTGQTATETVFFNVLDPQQPTAPLRSGEFVQVMKGRAQPGEEAVFWVGTGQPGHVLMAVEEGGKIVRQEWLTVGNTPLRVALPVQEKHRGGFGVHFAMVQNGRLLTESQTVAVPFTNKQLTVETETFRDKLQPGQAEQWSLRVSGPDQDKVLAELVATLYDASLDQFVAHGWPTSFYQTYTASRYWTGGPFGTQTTQPHWYEPEPTYLQVPRVFPDLSWGPYIYEAYNGRFRVHRVVPQTATIWVQHDGDVLTGRVLIGQVMGLPGVSVRLKGTKQGATTTVNGSFRLELPKTTKKPTLLFSLVGFLTTEVSLSDKRSVSATMEQDVTALDEMVVVGYGGLQQRVAVTGASVSFKRGRGDYAGASANMVGGVAKLDAPAPEVAEFRQADAAQQSTRGQSSGATVAPDVQPVIRKNFNETAFFFPQLHTDAQGRVVLKFTMPEALTSWKLLTFAHTKTMQTGSSEATARTQKELMVTTNVPRFLREGDTLRLTARLDNLSQRPLSGTARLDVTDALTGEPLTLPMKLNAPDVAFTANAGQSALATWRLVVPENLPPVAFRVTARAGTFTDGEERVVPVLPNRMLVTDVQPFWINSGDKAKTVRLTELASRNPELPTQTERLTVEVTSNPAWYALQSLPYLMEYPYDCAEQLFSKLYANALGAHILGSRPAFRQVVEAWKQMPPRSPLAKNEELKAVVLENTPWLADAKAETDRTAQLGQFFDASRLAAEQRRAIGKLRQLQGNGGGLPWFAGMQPNTYVSLHVLAGLGHLHKLGVRFEPDVLAELSQLESSLIGFVDAEAQRWMAREKQTGQRNGSPDSYWAATYLYARSFYLGSNPVGKDLQTYLLPVLQKGWGQSSLQGQALAALTLYRYGLSADALAVLQSLTERSKLSDELGLYWPGNVSGPVWQQAPVETQAYLIEAYLEAGSGAVPGTGDPFAWYRRQPAFAKTTGNGLFIDKMRQWLVQQKRTQSWPSTKATTEAVYALLLTGSDWLDTKNTVTVRVGAQDIARRATQIEALTGYQKVTFAPAEVTPAMGVIEVSKSAGTGISWGAAYWQHFEPIDAVARSAPGHLNVQKTLFQQRNTNAGPVLDPITPQTPLKPGDLLSVRVVLTTDRAMEYVHLKDGRASGFEPVAALSGTKYQNGLLYYEAPRDASTDFFVEYLPVGTHVFEYNLRVVHAGDFGTGVATVQCFYAPEFAAHSSGGRVQVK